MGQQTTALAVRNRTLNRRDPADCLTNKAALLECEVKLLSFIFLLFCFQMKQEKN